MIQLTKANEDGDRVYINPNNIEMFYECRENPTGTHIVFISGSTLRVRESMSEIAKVIKTVSNL